MVMNRSDWPQYAVTPVDRFYVGWDIGQAVDPSALAVIEHIVTAGDWVANEKTQVWKQSKTERFLCRHLERIPLGTSYPLQIEYVKNPLSRDPLNKGATTLALDFTGVGRPCADMIERAGLRAEKILITGGTEVTRHNGDEHHVPKAHLVAQLETRLHSGEFKIAPELEESAVLKEELRDFSRKVSETGRVTYSHRVGRHDDLILAICCALHAVTNRRFSSSEPINIETLRFRP